jgi:hypothetical protein
MKPKFGGGPSLPKMHWDPHIRWNDSFLGVKQPYQRVWPHFFWFGIHSGFPRQVSGALLAPPYVNRPLGGPKYPLITPPNHLGSVPTHNWHKSTQFALSFAPKMTKIFNKVQEISPFEGPGYYIYYI